MTRSPHWPPGLPQHLELPQTSLDENLAVSARRYPRRPATIYYGRELSYAELDAQVDALAGFLQQRCGVARGDRVTLFMQNCPQFIIAFHAILRADAVVVPVNSMNRLEEVRHIVADSGARVALVAQELAPELLPLRGQLLDHVVVATYSDYADPGSDLPVPDVVTQPREAFDGAVAWADALAERLAPSEHLSGPDDLAVMPYTSGTTGRPRGCLHTHRSVMHTTVAGPEWCFAPKDTVVLACLPMFHVTGLQNGVCTPVWRGNTIVVMTRWDRRCAALLIERHRAGSWTTIPTMLMDFLNQDLSAHDLSSMHILTGGGAAMPKAVAARIRELWGIDYVEGYGLSETMAPTHLNPVHRPKAQCLGLPIFDVDSRVVDPQTFQELPPGEVGEIVSHGPQVMLGYHGHPQDDPGTFVGIDGKRFLRTGDLGYVDEEGYFFMVDRLKRMINASGFKIWPAEVEALLYDHPAVQEACVIGTRDPHRGESAKAVVVLREGHDASGDDIIQWARAHMAAYKVPQAVEFRTTLPRSGTGKVQWRALQEAEDGHAS